jgi:pheromone shutdown protein TraB
MAVTGKTGADAVFKAIKRVTIVISHYAPKFLAVIAVMEAGGNITSVEAATIRAFITSLNDLMAALSKVAAYSGF